MNILLYVPDNHITPKLTATALAICFAPTTPAPHRVTIIDENVVRIGA